MINFFKIPVESWILSLALIFLTVVVLFFVMLLINFPLQGAIIIGIFVITFVIAKILNHFAPRLIDSLL